MKKFMEKKGRKWKKSREGDVFKKDKKTLRSSNKEKRRDENKMKRLVKR